MKFMGRIKSETYLFYTSFLWKIFAFHLVQLVPENMDSKLIERNPPPRGGFPPPRGGFLVTMFSDQEPGGRGPPSKNLYQVRRGGSSSSGFLIRKHGKKENPRGGGVSFDQSVNKMQIETLNGEKILVKCKFQLNQNLNLNLYSKQIQSKSHSDLYREIPRNLNF